MDERLRLRVEVLMGEGVRCVAEMMRHLRHYATETLYPTDVHRESNRRFFPEETDIRNCMNIISLRQRISQMDQDNVEHFMATWKNNHPDDLVEFRKSEQSVADAESLCDNLDGDIQVKSPGEKKLLVVYQSSDQKRLRHLYSRITLLDATYKTTQYSLPLYFVAVRTNVDYQVVATFTTEDETKSSLIEAQTVLKDNNMGWNPQYFLTDCDEEEISSLEDVFRGTNTKQQIHI